MSYTPDIAVLFQTFPIISLFLLNVVPIVELTSGLFIRSLSLLILGVILLVTQQWPYLSVGFYSSYRWLNPSLSPTSFLLSFTSYDFSLLNLQASISIGFYFAEYGPFSQIAEIILDSKHLFSVLTLCSGISSNQCLLPSHS